MKGEFRVLSVRHLILLLVISGVGWGLAANESYQKICSACHQANGEGVEAVFPPLKGWAGRLAKTPEGRKYLVQVVSFGMNDTIETNGISYIGYMPPNPQMSDGELTQLLNYITQDLTEAGTAKPIPFEKAEVTSIRQKKMGMDSVFQNRKKAIDSLTGK